MDHEALREIGFNDSLSGAGKIMVQTEVLGREGTKIRTTVLARGVVQLSEDQPCGPTMSVSDVRKAARLQHERVLAETQMKSELARVHGSET